MKNVFLALLMFVGVTALAQEKKERKPEREKLTTEQKIDFQVKKMTKDLSLNEKQATEIRAVISQEIEKREALKAELKEKKAQKREELKSKRQQDQAALETNMKKILTAEQFTKWEKNREEKKDKMAEKIKDRRVN